MTGAFEKVSIKLRGATDFKATLNEVIKDIRLICSSEVCTVLLINQVEYYTDHPERRYR